MFVGVEPLWEFDYGRIRVFARKVLSSLAGELPATKTVIVTVHGPGYGLDEDEAFESQVAGFLDAIGTSDAPDALERIVFVERNEGRASRLESALKRIIPSGGVVRGDSAWAQVERPESRERLRAVGYASPSKPHIFVAMPFAEEMDDVYHYGIGNAARTAGLLSERADLTSFTGDVLEWVKQRISTAALVVADLSGANPNVYLEVGFAWGCGVPTVLLARDVAELKFDVKGQRCLVYTKIRELEEKLTAELRALDPRAVG